MPPPALSLYRPLAGALGRIVAFPHAGGGASAFIRLRNELASAGIELCPLQPPGRENRTSEPHHSSAEALATELVAALETLAPIRTAFLGHSFGGLVAYLVAQRLAGRGAAPSLLIASGSLSPALRQGKITEETPAEFRKRVAAFGGIPDSIAANAALYEMFEAVIRADMRLSDAYRHRQSDPLPCPIMVYSGTEDHAAPPDDAQAWQGLTRHPLRLRNFAGGHFFLYANPKATAEALVSDLGWN